MLHLVLRRRGRTVLLVTVCPEPEPEQAPAPERGPGAFLAAGELAPPEPDTFGYRTRSRPGAP